MDESALISASFATCWKEFDLEHASLFSLVELCVYRGFLNEASFINESAENGRNETTTWKRKKGKKPWPFIED